MYYDPIDELRIILREESSPFFSEDDLEYYYEKNNKDINNTAYECFLIKAEDDSISLPGGLSLPNNKEYWLRLARKYRPNGSKIL